ncbi:MAG: InlB B-repeat-containing protein [Lachnospiraceae bacterium]|nr:InlB B-repeat-containing protein [Lachnospiraceae bacterium]
MKKILSVILAFLLVAGLSPAMPAKAVETIDITYTSKVNDGDTPVLPTISSGYEFVGGTFIEDTNKNDTFHDDKVMVMDPTTLQATATLMNVTPDALIAVYAAQGYTLLTTFRGGYRYTFVGQIKRSDNTLFPGANGDHFTGIINVNETDKTSEFEINEGLIAITDTCGIIYECGSSATTKTLKGITITTAPTTTVYTEGQSFNPAGMVVTATYSDNSTAEVKTYTISPSAALATTDTSVTISYTEDGVTKTAAQAITVNPASSTIEIIDITYTSKVNDGDTPVLPTLSSGYEFVNGVFVEDTDKNGAYYNEKVMVMDPTTLQAMATLMNVTPDDLIALSAAQGVTIMKTFRGGYSYTFTGQIKRSDNTLFPGADSDPFTGIINVNNSDKTSEFEISKGLIAITDTCGIIYECGSSATTKTLKGITITTAPTTTVYTEGQSFDPAGMVVTATYSDNSTAEVKTYTISPSGALATTDTSVTISYTEDGVTKTATQAITVSAAVTKTLSSIAITTAPTTTIYTEGQNFDPAGMVVTATYSDNSTAEVKAYTVSPSGALGATDASVTISYTEDGVTKTATQTITVNPVIETFAITFAANGHGTAPAAQTVESGKTATKPSDPTASGWTFGGWYTEATCTNAFDFSKAITGDVTIYAKWTEDKTSEEPSYIVTVGDNGSVAQGNDMTVTVKRNIDDNTCFSHFTGVQIDGKDCAAGDYDAKAGSTIVTLKAATIQALSVGTHTISIIFDDGKVETKLTVEKAVSAGISGAETVTPAVTGTETPGSSVADASPTTGDALTNMIYILLILSAFCLCGAFVIRKKGRNIEA